MNYVLKVIVHSVLSLFIVFTFFVTAHSIEIDDSTVFIEAFNAYQLKDYLLTIEKCDQLNQVFPESPLRDVTLLLSARASLKSGNNMRAAKLVILFSNEFPESSLNSSVESELKVLANRHKKGEVLAVDTTLHMAASKVRADTIAREQAAELKRETERVAKVKAEQERLYKLKRDEERREQERLLAEKIAKANIKVAILLNEDTRPVPVGNNAAVPFEISNIGKNSEELLLTIMAAKEYGAKLAKAGKSDESLTTFLLGAGETIKGTVQFKMPTEMVDGHRAVMTLNVASAKFNDVNFQKETIVISSAPLVRAVAKFASHKVIAGEILSYRVTILNAGSLPARNLSVRLQLPPQASFHGALDSSFKQEPDGSLVFKVDQIDIGKLVEKNLDVKIREGSAVGQELRGNVEIANDSLKRKDVFAARASVVAQAK